MARIALIFWAWGMGVHSSQLSAVSNQRPAFSSQVGGGWEGGSPQITQIALIF
jgi:hypothetical protein